MKELTLTDISKFLNEEVIEKAFKVKTGEDKVECIQLSPIGESLLSVVYRIRTKGSQHSTSFVGKGFITNPLLRRSLDCPKYFEREITFFTTILPVLIELQVSLGAKERIQNHIPICYDCYRDGFNDYLLLEDLGETGCSPLPINPTPEQRNSVLNVLAHFHAVSMALRIKRLEVFNKLIKPIPELYLCEENREWYRKYLSTAFEIDRQVISEFEDSYSIYYKKFCEVLETDMFGDYIASVNNHGDHPVLCHGDVWRPNFLTSPKRMVAIDFQGLRCASLATELTYWTMQCCTTGTTKQDFLNSIDVYYKSLEYYLKDMRINAAEVFPRTALNKELKLYGRHGYLACLIYFPLEASDKSDVKEFTEAMFPGVDKLPLETIWKLTPMKKMEDKVRLVNVLHVAVDMGFI